MATEKNTTIQEAKQALLNKIASAAPGDAQHLAQAHQTLMNSEMIEGARHDSMLADLFRKYVAHVDRHMRAGKDPEWTLKQDNEVRRALGLDTIDDD